MKNTLLATAEEEDAERLFRMDEEGGYVREWSSTKLKWALVVSISLFAMAVVGIVSLAVLLVEEKKTSSSSTDSYGSKHDFSSYDTAPSGTWYTAAVATDVPYCSEMGAKLMQDNPAATAVDAAIIGALCVGVLSPGASGVGGGAGMLIRTTSGEITMIDCRETAPAAATEDMYLELPVGSSVMGPLASGVPGEFHCLYDAWQQYGGLAWKDVVQPVADLARNFTVDAYLARSLKSHSLTLFRDPTMRQVFSNDGVAKTEGEHCQWIALADTLERIADETPSVLYQGDLGEALVADIQAGGGIITMDDLRNYHAVRRTPVETFYQGHHLISAPIPFGGSVMLMSLNIMEAYNLPLLGYSALGQHWMLEGWKFAYADRLALGDPDFVPEALDYQTIMLNKTHDAELRQRLKPHETFPPEHYEDLVPISQQPRSFGTSHISTVDRNRMTVAITTTINLGFGAQWASNSTGILMNNEMDDFSTPNTTNSFGYPPSQNNFIKPGKRPLSSMTPTIVLKDNELYMSVGASGGSRIITATCQVILNRLAYGMTAGEAVGAPRVHDQLIPDVVRAEELYPQDFIETLQSMEYDITPSGTLANAQVIIVNDDESLNAASDWRKLGAPAGF